MTNPTEPNQTNTARTAAILTALIRHGFSVQLRKIGSCVCPHVITVSGRSTPQQPQRDGGVYAHALMKEAQS